MLFLRYDILHIIAELSSF